MGIVTGATVQLARNFTLREMCRTNTGLPNEPTTDAQLASLVVLCTSVLQPTRDVFGPLDITSGFRSAAVNAALPRPGSPTSQHLRGEAADFRARNASQREVFVWMARNKSLPIGQLIYENPEPGVVWIHASLPRKGKAREHMVYDGNSYVAWKGVT